MDSELTLFSDDTLPVAYDYAQVTAEQADKLQVIYKRVLIRHIATTYEDGKDLYEAKATPGLPYKEFIASASATFGWSERTIVDKMNAALRWGDFTAPGAVIEDKAMYVLSTKTTPESARQEAKSLLASGQDIDEAMAKEIRDRHKAELAQRESQNEQLQPQFDFSQQETELTHPETVTIYEDTPETKEQLAKLQAELEERTQQRDNLARLRKELSAELDEQRDANEARREQELYEFQINERVKKICGEWGRTTVQLLGLLPSPIESQVVTADNWALIEHITDMAQRTISTINRVKTDKVAIFIESEGGGEASC